MNYATRQAAIDNANYFNDPRSRGRAEQPILYVEADDGGIDEIPLPTTWEICGVCDGEGKHVNPSIDCGGLTSEDLYDDPDFADDYRRGAYDIPCRHCDGTGKVRDVDWGALTDEQREAYQEQLEGEAADRAERLAEIRMGA